MKLTTTAALLLVASVAQANPQSAMPILHKGKIVASAVRIAGGYALTAEHVIVMGRRAGGEHRIGLAFDTFIVVNSVKLNNTDEAVLLRINGDGSGPISKIATTPPKVGDVVSTVGFPAGKRTTLRGYVTRVYKTFRGDVTKGYAAAFAIEADLLTQSGHSGGALWNSDGELIGLLAATGKNKQGQRILPSLWIGLPSIVTAVAHKNQKQIIVFAATWCDPCKQLKADPRTKNWRFVYADTQEYARLRAQFHAELRAKGEPIPAEVYPTVWVEGTALYIIEKSVIYVIRWIGKVGMAVFDPVLPPDQQVQLPDERYNQMKVIEPPPPPVEVPSPYIRSTDSKIDGLKGTIGDLKDDIAAVLKTAKDAKETADGLKDAGLIGKIRALNKLKGNVEDIRSKLSNIKDSTTELKDGLKDKRAIASALFGIIGWFYRRRRAK